MTSKFELFNSVTPGLESRKARVGELLRSLKTFGSVDQISTAGKLGILKNLGIDSKDLTHSDKKTV